MADFVVTMVANDQRGIILATVPTFITYFSEVRNPRVVRVESLLFMFNSDFFLDN